MEDEGNKSGEVPKVISEAIRRGAGGLEQNQPRYKRERT
jgi:hypothetical protein